MSKYCSYCMRELDENGKCTECQNDKSSDIAAHHLRPDTVLNNKYIVGRALGEGGFGITYIGRDTTLDIKVAIKEYFPSGYVNRNHERSSEITATTEKQKDFFKKGKERFLLEARSIAKFNREKGVVDVRDYFEENGTAYIIMEYLDGNTLSEHIKQNGKMDAKELFEKMKPIMKSLEKMHSAGIIHRDISPDNIMCLSDGTLKLMDFGSARYFANEEKMMSVMLKQGYAPEEQYRKNGDQGPWTDVYGMCATMYKCITGVVPEDALDRLHEDTLKKPSQLGVSIAQPLELTLMYGLAVNKNNRCKDMAELLELTQRALADNLETTAFNSPATDVYKTQAADDDMYKTQAAENAYPVNAPVVPDSTYANQLNGVPMYNPAPKKKNNALVALIIATIAFLVIAVVVLFAVLLSDDSSDYVYTPIHSDSSQVVETEEPTEKPTEKETEAKKVEVPDVEGMYYEDAKSKLKSAGLKVKEEWQDSSSVEYGYVISQTPSAYKTAEKDDKVKIYVSQTYQYDDVYYSAASDDLTLREAPARGAKKITSIGYNHRIGVLDYACTSEYSYVEYRGYKGYVMTYYLSKSPNPTPDPSPEPPSPNSELNNVNLTTYYCRASDHANLREKPSSKSKSLDTIPCRGMVVGIDPGGDFYLVEYNGKVGYVLKEVFSTDPDAPLSYID